MCLTNPFFNEYLYVLCVTAKSQVFFLRRVHDLQDVLATSDRQISVVMKIS